VKTHFKAYSNAISQALTRRFCHSLAQDSETCRPLVDRVDAQDFSFLANYDIEYSADDSVCDIIARRQILGFFKKNLELPLDIDRTAVAHEKFIKSEENCRSINRKFRGASLCESSVESILYIAQRKISDVLGSVPSLENLNFSFGPGANFDVRGFTTPRWKLSSRPACSADMLGVVSNVLSEVPLVAAFWADSESQDSWIVPVDVVPGELMFVAKNALTDRSIIVEPSLNTFIQKGIGSFMKERLLNVGVNLYDQHVGKRTNRRRAHSASINDGLATIDLSSASDNIAKQLVMQLLPYDWYDFLSSYRTGRVYDKFSDTYLELEKFSSMRNGFTFELESLIFYALSYAVCVYEGVTPDISVYGDDIILPKEVIFRLREVFTKCGFEINMSKSYFSGPFRESCGGDYFLGQNVRPYYQKSNWSRADLFAFHNFLIRNHLDLMFPSLFQEVLSSIPVHARSFGPDGFGDGHLIDRDWRPEKVFRKSHGYAGGCFSTIIQSPRRVIHGLLPGDYLLPFYMAMVGSKGESVYNVRGSTKKARVVRVYTLGW